MKIKCSDFLSNWPRKNPEGKTYSSKRYFILQAVIQTNYNNTYLLEIHAIFSLANCCTITSIFVLYDLTRVAVRTSKSVPNLLLYEPRFLCCTDASKFVPAHLEFHVVRLPQNLCCTGLHVRLHVQTIRSAFNSVRMPTINVVQSA